MESVVTTSINIHVVRKLFPKTLDVFDMETKKEPPRLSGQKKPGVLGTMRSRMRLRHMSFFTEKTYLHWVRCFLKFHARLSPIELNETHIVQYLSYIASEKHVAASTQNQALNAIVFLFKNVLQKNVAECTGIVWARKPKRLPTVLSIEDVFCMEPVCD